MHESLSDTEHLLLSYIRLHSPEECMLDKISLGTGKSRATVLKYLGILYAKEILDFRIIGRSKLWFLKKNTGELFREPSFIPPKTLSDNDDSPVSVAFELCASRRRQAELSSRLDILENPVLTVMKDGSLITCNYVYSRLFKQTDSFLDIVSLSQIPVFTRLLQADPSEEKVIELDLKEKSGIFRPYRFQVFPGTSPEIEGCFVLIGEDLTDQRRTRRHLEALLHIIRAIRNTSGREAILQEGLKTVKEELLPFMNGYVFSADLHLLYSTLPCAEISDPLLSDLIHRSMQNCETLSSGSDPMVLKNLYASLCHPYIAGGTIISVPVLEEEYPSGVIVLVLEKEAESVDIENLEIIADEISNALRLERLSREKTEYTNTLLALNRISVLINETRDEGAILEKSIDATMEILGFEMGCVFLVDEKEDLVSRVHRNMPESLQEMCISGIFNYLFERAISERTILYLTKKTPEFSFLKDLVATTGLQTMLILPIISGDTVMGLLNMGSRDEKCYLKTSLENLFSIGLQLGIALERSRLASRMKDGGS